MTPDNSWVLVVMLVLIGGLLTCLVNYVYHAPDVHNDNKDTPDIVKNSRERLLSIGERE